jgi:hypothetical protein
VYLSEAIDNSRPQYLVPNDNNHNILLDNFSFSNPNYNHAWITSQQSVITDAAVDGFTRPYTPSSKSNNKSSSSGVNSNIDGEANRARPISAAKQRQQQASQGTGSRPSSSHRASSPSLAQQQATMNTVLLGSNMAPSYNSAYADNINTNIVSKSNVPVNSIMDDSIPYRSSSGDINNNGIHLSHFRNTNNNIGYGATGGVKFVNMRSQDLIPPEPPTHSNSRSSPNITANVSYGASPHGVDVGNQLITPNSSLKSLKSNSSFIADLNMKLNMINNSGASNNDAVQSKTKIVKNNSTTKIKGEALDINVAALSDRISDEFNNNNGYNLSGGTESRQRTIGSTDKSSAGAITSPYLMTTQNGRTKTLKVVTARLPSDAVDSSLRLPSI